MPVPDHFGSFDSPAKDFSGAFVYSSTPSSHGIMRAGITIINPDPTSAIAAFEVSAVRNEASATPSASIGFIYRPRKVEALRELIFSLTGKHVASQFGMWPPHERFLGERGVDGNMAFHAWRYDPANVEGSAEELQKLMDGMRTDTRVCASEEGRQLICGLIEACLQGRQGQVQLSDIGLRRISDQIGTRTQGKRP